MSSYTLRNESTGFVLLRGFRTSDGHIVVAAGNDSQFVRVCQVLGLDRVSKEPKYKTNTLRVQNRRELLPLLQDRFVQESTSDWLRRFEGSGVPVGPINSMEQVFSDPQVSLHWDCSLSKPDLEDCGPGATGDPPTS
ncbi:hypothetical protein WMY93_032972 [Mugilogobius chulae]|uniref:Uncharacterized protein n=1 Tax=Mugilogobius chulae TaxID=88201 RepID=A0AAW0MMM4_9GOBI